MKTVRIDRWGIYTRWFAIRFSGEARDHSGALIHAFQFAIDVAWGPLDEEWGFYPHSLRIPLSPVIPAREYWTRFDGGSRAGRYRR